MKSNFSNTRDSQQHGIAIIHQELNLPTNISIAQNMYLGRLPHNALGMVDTSASWLKMRENLGSGGS
jgi:ABC-type sugar transport system ATPase subunit